MAFRKVTEIVGYTYDDSVYCPSCYDTVLRNANDDDVWPVFLSDADGSETCDGCLEALDV
jgi:hypothetical protein